MDIFVTATLKRKIPICILLIHIDFTIFLIDNFVCYCPLIEGYIFDSENTERKVFIIHINRDDEGVEVNIKS